MNIKTIMGYHFTPVRMTIIKMSTDKINAGEGVGEKEYSNTVGGNVSWYSYYGEQYRDCSKK